MTYILRFTSNGPQFSDQHLRDKSGLFCGQIFHLVHVLIAVCLQSYYQILKSIINCQLLKAFLMYRLLPSDEYFTFLIFTDPLDPLHGPTVKNPCCSSFKVFLHSVPSIVALVTSCALAIACVLTYKGHAGIHARSSKFLKIMP